MDTSAGGILRISSSGTGSTRGSLVQFVAEFLTFGPGIQEALETLSTTATTEENLSDIVADKDGLEALSDWYYIFRQLEKAVLLAYVLEWPGGPRVVLRPTSYAFQYRTIPVNEKNRIALSRFAWGRRNGSAMLIESAVGLATIEVCTNASIPVLSALCEPISVEALRKGPWRGIDDKVFDTFVQFLLNSGAVVMDDKSGADVDNPPPFWEFHDLLFHSRSREGRHGRPSGATFRFGRSAPPRSQRALDPRASTIKLTPHDEVPPEQMFNPYLDILRRRRSRREHPIESLTLEQLSLFLEFSMGSRPGNAPDTESSRYYPSAGHGYELETYLCVSSCLGIEPGLYYYDPKFHSLQRISACDDRVSKLVKRARYAAQLQNNPAVLLILAARFEHLMRKYESIAYSLVLKNVGAVFQTMYLTATALGLSPCAVGVGDTDLFASVAGLKYFEESSVGEFILNGTATDKESPDQRVIR